MSENSFSGLGPAVGSTGKHSILSPAPALRLLQASNHTNSRSQTPAAAGHSQTGVNSAVSSRRNSTVEPAMNSASSPMMTHTLQLNPNSLTNSNSSSNGHTCSILGLPANSSLADQLSAARKKQVKYLQKLSEIQSIIMELENSESGSNNHQIHHSHNHNNHNYIPSLISTGSNHNTNSHDFNNSNYSDSAAIASSPILHRRRSSTTHLPGPLALISSKSVGALGSSSSGAFTNPPSVSHRNLSSSQPSNLSNQSPSTSSLMIQTKRSSQSSELNQLNSDSTPQSPFSASASIRQRSQQRASNSSVLDFNEAPSPIDGPSNSPTLGSSSLFGASHTNAMQPISLPATQSAASTQRASTRSTLVSNLSSPSRAQLLKPTPVPELDSSSLSLNLSLALARSDPPSPGLPPVKSGPTPTKYSNHGRVSSIVETRQTAERIAFNNQIPHIDESHSSSSASHLPSTQVANFTRSPSRNLAPLAVPTAHNRARSSSVPYIYSEEFPFPGDESSSTTAAAESKLISNTVNHSPRIGAIEPINVSSFQLEVKESSSRTRLSFNNVSTSNRPVTPIASFPSKEDSSESSSSSNFSSPRMGNLSRDQDSHRSSIADSPRLLASGSSTDRSLAGSTIASPTHQTNNNSTSFSLNAAIGSSSSSSSNIGIQVKPPPIPVLARVVITSEDQIHDITDIFSPRNEFEEAEPAT